MYYGSGTVEHLLYTQANDVTRAQQASQQPEDAAG